MKVADAMKQPIRTHLSAEERERLGQEATARGISISQCLRECLGEYFALRAEVATAFETPGRPGEPRTGLIHTLLARTEARLVGTLETCAEAVGRVRADVPGVQSMRDRVAVLDPGHPP